MIFYIDTFNISIKKRRRLKREAKKKMKKVLSKKEKDETFRCPSSLRENDRK